jgi:hypothetical protein
MAGVDGFATRFFARLLPRYLFQDGSTSAALFSPSCAVRGLLAVVALVVVNFTIDHPRFCKLFSVYDANWWPSCAAQRSDIDFAWLLTFVASGVALLWHIRPAHERQRAKVRLAARCRRQGIWVLLTLTW